MKESIFNYFDSIKKNDHIAHFYSKNSEKFEIGARFIADGLRLNQKCVVISDKKAHADLISRIGLYDIDIEKYKSNEKFIEISLHNKEGNEKTPEHLLDTIEQLISYNSEKREDETIRIVLNRKPAFLNLNENYQLNLEARLNLQTVNNPLIVINQFELTTISSKFLFSILKTHPLIIEEDFIYKNCFYSNPSNIILKLNGEFNKLEKLTRQEIIVLTGIVNGLSNKDISNDLSISVRTVETHRYNIMKKTETTSIIELIKLAIKNGLY